jgi:tetratricopeptide (TPR) repeat protein
MKMTVLLALLVVSNGNMLAGDLPRAVEDCRALVGAITPPVEDGDELLAYEADARRAYRDCRGERFPVEIRVNALVKYALAISPRGETQAAVAAFAEAIDLLDRDPAGNAQLLITVLDQASLLEAQVGLRENAVTHAARSSEIRIKTYGKTSSEAAIGLVQLGLVYGNFNDYERGEKLVREAIHLAEKHCGPRCNALVQAYHGMEALYATRGNKAEAKKYGEMALAVATSARETGSKE